MYMCIHVYEVCLKLSVYWFFGQLLTIKVLQVVTCTCSTIMTIGLDSFKANQPALSSLIVFRLVIDLQHTRTCTCGHAAPSTAIHVSILTSCVTHHSRHCSYCTMTIPGWYTCTCSIYMYVVHKTWLIPGDPLSANMCHYVHTIYMYTS